jgi:hypothetical protein
MFTTIRIPVSAAACRTRTPLTPIGGGSTRTFNDGGYTTTAHCFGSGKSTSSTDRVYASRTPRVAGGRTC